MTHILSHRGARDLWAENSALGFKRTAALGVDAVEFDLHLTDDGQILVIHDATLDRSTSGSGPVSALTGNDRSHLRLIGPGGKIDEGIPTFDEVLEILGPHNNMKLFVELKAGAGGRPYPALPRLAAEALARRGLADRAVLTSFDISVLQACRDVAPDIPRLLSVDTQWAEHQSGLDAVMDSAEGLATYLAVEDRLFEAQFDRITARWPLDRLCVWTVNDPTRIRMWLERKPGYLTTDNPILATEIALALKKD
ncbi:glycerophosphodiester phosphodiesterase family protein [Falsirhodobacter sp. alg1]|uniref:glycerophosphodiester phosphodiesterase family protein n=1 Tax=Falsirhodobacter sp. alg1 TaxID=1472418 RepID=UPI00078818AC|nr:glycerophosphodiester phosphodiesterase family protein [Falsirhodobacter sp. alg1]